MSQHENHAFEHRDDEAKKLGMWLFIFTELLLFGGLFLVYSIFRSQYPDSFHEGSLELSVTIGAINTIILLVSSASVAVALTAIQKNNTKLSMQMLLLTVFLAAAFLVNKYFEWGAKFHHGLYPGSELMQLLDRGHHLYFSLYFFMTGLHALHIIIGMILLLISYFKVKAGKVKMDDFMHLENAALYWHLVDLIWIFLFPLMYLIS
ncbi:MAG: cytochrome C oxidase subunit III [Porphyromonadaceae bacterium CG2_30_38_12]|nr:MAG: cytochrome C oxidase subunit III [Porphyromonadaceae bacterium CG2_30_38_12]